MKTKVVFKLFVLFLGLLLFAVFKNCASSGGINEFFSSFDSGKKKLNWCADHVVDFTWLDTSLPSEVKALSPSNLKDNFCELEIEDISGIDTDKLDWQPLAETAGAAGAKSDLQWNRASGVYKSGGLLFKSSKLSKELGQEVSEVLDEHK